MNRCCTCMFFGKMNIICLNQSGKTNRYCLKQDQDPTRMALSYCGVEVYRRGEDSVGRSKIKK